MRKILITAAEILVWIFCVCAMFAFVIMTLMALDIMLGGFFLLGWAYELITVIVSAFILSGAIVMKASQDILKQKLENSKE